MNKELDKIEHILNDQTFIQAGPKPDWADPLTPYKQYPLVGCRLKDYAKRWEILFPNSIAHVWLREGVPLQFLDAPPPLQREPVEFPIAQELERQQSTLELLQKGVIEVVHDKTSPGLYHRLFMRPKPDGSLRPIIDLSPLNALIHNEAFKMETPASIRQALQTGEHTLQLDLKDAYFHVPIRKAYRKYMRFYVQGVVYQYKALPFGLSIAPRIFAKILKPILALLRETMIRVHAYLDDWIMRLHDPRMGHRTAYLTVSLLRMLGWLVNFPKSVLYPRLSFEFIGLEWDLKVGSIKPREEKVTQFKKDCRVVKTGKLITAKKLASIIGVIKWMAEYVPLGKMHLKKLQLKVRTQWSQKRDGWKAKIMITRSMQDLIKWWTRQVNTRQGVPLKTPVPDREIFTDASCHGYGAIMGKQKMSGVWSRRYKDHHINVLELDAVRRALVTFAENVENSTVRVHSDNRTTVACLRRQGSLRSRILNSITAKILTWSAERNITIIPVHIQGYRNVEADALSRKDVTHTSEWSLSQKEFNKVVTWSRLQPPWLDLMATPNNRQTDSFICPYPHEEAMGTDALNMTWNFPGTVWLYPPTSTMTKVISKIKEVEKLTMILIAPDLQGKPWYPDLLSMTASRTLQIGKKQGSIIQHVPHLEMPVTMEEPEILKLRAWIIQKG